MDIGAQLTKIRNEIDAAAQVAGRNPSDITLIAVTKTQPAEAVRAAYDAGQRIFGENRIQEAIEKIDALRDLPGISWHLIGHLQSNKAKAAVKNFDIIHSIDKMSTLIEVSKHAGKMNKMQDVLLEFNTSGEESKSGMPLDKGRAFIKMCRDLYNVRIRGVMTVGLWSSDEQAVRACFRRLTDTLAELRDERPDLVLDMLSMGMTDDYQIAIEMGSTMVRIGRAIFGERPKND